MVISIEAIIFYILLLDSIGANIGAWFDGKFYTKHFKIFSRWFPITKGWCAYYLILVLWVGSLLLRNGSLPI